MVKVMCEPDLTEQAASQEFHDLLEEIDYQKYCLLDRRHIDLDSASVFQEACDNLSDYIARLLRRFPALADPACSFPEGSERRALHEYLRDTFSDVLEVFLEEQQRKIGFLQCMKDEGDENQDDDDGEPTVLAA